LSNASSDGLRRLAELGVYVVLSFDTFDAGDSERLHGADLVETKLKAIENLGRAGVRMTLLNVLIRGVNEDVPGRLLDLMRRQDHILSLTVQTMTYTGQGGGRVAGVNYNSTTPLAEQLKSLSLGMTDDPTSTELFQALRGQRVEVTGAAGGPITGRLLSIESRTEKTGGGDSAATIEKFFLSVIATSGAVRVIELTPALSVRPLDSNLQGQLDRYLELLSTTHANGLRHLTLDAIGQGQRQLRVSYISEVPVWKSTYRIVFPRTPSGSATMQGWAVVDNTVGADWDNVQLSLVSGAPQSFIQPLSQPIYTRRVEIPIAVDAQLTPQTHEAAEEEQTPAAAPSAEAKSARLYAPTRIPHDIKMVTEKEAPSASFGVAGSDFGASSNSANTVAITSEGNISRASDAFKEGDVTTNAFDDFFEYALTQPVTIHKNESAMVPILQQELPAEHVTLWSENEPTPLRAVWLENKSKLTLDSGSFSIFESGEFAGEGLLDPIHPGEKRLLSYAADQAVHARAKTSIHFLAEVQDDNDSGDLRFQWISNGGDFSSHRLSNEPWKVPEYTSTYADGETDETDVVSDGNYRIDPNLYTIWLVVRDNGTNSHSLGQAWAEFFVRVVP